MANVSILLAALGLAGASPDGVLLDFTATWCGPCQSMSPIVARLQRQGYPIRKVDVDQHPELARRYGVRSIPAFVLVVRGKECNRIVGMTSEGQLRRLLKQIPEYAARGANDTPRPRKTLPKTGTAPERNSVPPLVRSRQPEAGDFQAPSPVQSQQNRETGTDEPIARAEPDVPVIRAKYDKEDDVAPGRSAPRPLASSVRLRVKDRGSINFGSGTVIQSRPGRTLILTCGHVLRGLSDSAQILVDVFEGRRSEAFLAEVVASDLEADVGLIAIRTEAELPWSPVASNDGAIAAGDPVVSIGCGGGESPTPEQIQVARLNPYLGPANVECTGTPKQGRSGGGLFDRQGKIIGVCIAADPSNSCGLYAGLKAVHGLLDQSELAHLYRPDEPAESGSDPEFAMSTGGPADARPEEAAADVVALEETGNPTGASPAPTREFTPAPQPQRRPRPQPRPDVESIVKAAGGAEVVCIIRPRDDSAGGSRVVVIHRASPKFVSYLKGELESQPHPTMKSVKVEKPAGSSPFVAAEEPQRRRYRRSREAR